MKPIRFAFNSHGLGDCVHAATALRLYIADGYDIQIAVEPNKRFIWQAAGIPIYDGPDALPLHPYHYLPSMNAFWDLSLPDHSSSKIAGFFDIEELPKLGEKEEVWRRVCTEQARMDASHAITNAAMVEAQLLISSLPRPIILLHAKGTNWQAEKSIPDATAFALIMDLIASFDGSIITLDWDARSPTLDHPRVRPAGRISTEVFGALCMLSDLLIGIDSGPFHLAQWFDIPTVFVAREIPCVRCCIPNPRAKYLVPAKDHKHWVERDVSSPGLWNFAEFKGGEAAPIDITFAALSMLENQPRKVNMTLDSNTIPGMYTYRRVGYDERPMELRDNGTIGEGGAGAERWWTVEKTPWGTVLAILGDQQKPTCYLHLEADGVLRGRWLRHEKMPIELIRDEEHELTPQIVRWDDLAVTEPVSQSEPGATTLPIVDLNDGKIRTWTPEQATELFASYNPAWNLPVGTRGNGMLWLLDPAVERSDLDSCGVDHEDWIYPHLSQPPGAVCLDLASFIGTNAIWWAKSGCKVIACEPLPRSRALLEKNIRLNRADKNIIVIPKAFGAAPGTMRMDSSLHYASCIGETGDVEVVVTTVDKELLPMLDGERLDIIKLDVEGAECEVIEGARETIKRFRPKLVIELHSHMDGRHENGTILAKQLGELGYSFRKIWQNIPTYYYVEAVPNA